MSSLENDSHQERFARWRPPPVVISKVDSPSAAGVTATAKTAQEGALIRAQGRFPTTGAAPSRFPSAVAGPLSALAGPLNREPLVYTGDAAASLAALRQDIVVNYRAICGALGEPERTELVNGSLPAAAALGLHVPLALRTQSAAARLPPVPFRSGLSPGPLLLLPTPPYLPGAAGAPGATVQPDENVAMGLGPGLGIEYVGTGAEAPAMVLTPGGFTSNSGAAAGAGAGAGLRSSAAMSGLRSLSAGHAGIFGRIGLPPLAPGRGVDKHWPMGRPGASSSIGSGAAGNRASLGSGDGPRIAMLSGFARPQDVTSDFLGEESAVVYPPPGHNFSEVARGGGRASLYGASGGFSQQSQLIDAMGDFHFRGGARKNIGVEDVADPSRRIPAFRRKDDLQVELFLTEYARDPSKTRAEEAGGFGAYRMPF